MPNRVHLFCFLSCGRSGSFRCSPPRLTATQLLPVLIRLTAANGRSLPLRRVMHLRSALERVLRGALPKINALARLFLTSSHGEADPPLSLDARYVSKVERVFAAPESGMALPPCGRKTSLGGL